MKKKVLYGAALALFASVSMGTLQSCKDDLSDLKHQNAYAHEDFQGQIDGLTTDLNGLKGDLENCKTECSNRIGALEQEILGLRSQIEGLGHQIETAEGNTDSLTQEMEALSQEMNGKLEDLAATVEALKTAGGAGLTLQEVQELLNAYAAKEDLSTVKTTLENLITEKLVVLQTQITNLETTLRNEITNFSTEFTQKLDSFSQKVAGLDTKVNDIITEQGQMAARLTKLETDYQTQLEAINAANKEIEQLWLQMNSQNELISQVYNSLKDDLTELGNQYAELANEYDLLIMDIFGDGGLRDQMSQMYTALQEAFQAGDEELWLAIQERDEQLTQAMNALRAEFAEVDQELWDTIGAVREEMSMYWFATQNSIEELGDELRNEDVQLWLAINGPGGLQEQLTQVLNLHAADIQALEEKIEDLNTKYNNLLGRVDTLITGILLQSTDSPVFGNFSLPIGVKSNVLFNWYGYQTNENFQFPSNKGMYAAIEDQVKGIDFKALGAQTETIQEGFLGDVNLGRVYLTVNPVGHNFDNTKFSLETSAGKALPFGLKISKSNDELYFGYSRSEVNGFYAADVVIEGDQQALNRGINATKLTIDDNLKTAVKDILDNRSKRNALNLLKAVYGQISNQLPAYAVRYDWKDADGNPYAVLSNYDLAIASAKPLSYNFDVKINHRLRPFGHLDNFIYKLKDNENLKFDFTKYGLTFDDGKYEIQIKPLVIDEKTVSVSGGSLTVQIPEITVYQTVNGEKVPVGKTDPTPVVVKDDDLKNLYDSIEKGIKDSIKSMTDQISDWTKELSDEVNGKVNDMLADVQSKLNNMLKEIGDDLTGRLENIIDDFGGKAQPWFDRLNKLVDLYNKVADRINDVLEDPNHYLQVAMFYQGGRAGINVVSNVKEDPTVFASGNGYVGLYASSYTAELVAPAYKKFVAVSNVYKKAADGKVVVADNAKAQMDNINGSNHLNEVMSGNTIRYYIPAEKLTKGLIYEIVYQGLDYHGVTSTQKFYITVK